MDRDRLDRSLRREPPRDLQPAEVARTLPRAKLHRHREPAPATGGLRQRHGPLRIVEQRRARARLADLRHRAAHVDVHHIGSRRGHALGGRGHHVGIVSEQLHGNGVFVGVDPQQLADGALVAVVDREARDHLRDHQPGPVALGLQAHEPVADPGQGREHHAIRDPHAAQGPTVCQRSSHDLFMVRITR